MSAACLQTVVAGTGRKPEPYLMYDLSSLVSFCCFAVHFETSDLHVQYTVQACNM